MNRSRSSFFIVTLSLSKGLWLLLLALCLASRGRAADMNVTIPWQDGSTFSTNINIYAATVGETKTLHVAPQHCYRFRGSISSAGTGVTIVETATTSTSADYNITIVDSGKEGIATIRGEIERDPSCTGGGGDGGGGNNASSQEFDISVLQRLAWIYFTDPTNGTNLTMCAGGTTNVAIKVVLGDATAPVSGTITFSAAPGNLGSFTPASVALSGGAASTSFIGSTNGGSGTITANASSLKDAAGNSVPNVSTNLMVVMVDLAWVDCWNPCAWAAQEDILFANGARSTIAVTVATDSSGAPVSGVPLSFTITGGGSITPSTANTGADGKVTTTVTAGNTTGTSWAKVIISPYATNSVRILMYKHAVGNGSFDFNGVITDDEFTTSPAAFDTAGEIKTWLQGKGSRLAGMVYAGKLISQIIHDAANANGINAQVILVTLQKEQGLITAPNPTDAQLNHAMECGSPSNIKAQIECGAQTFKQHFDNAPAMPYIFRRGSSAGQDSVGYYDPLRDIRVSVSMKVTNKASYSLYKYTPWIRYNQDGGGNLLFYQIWKGWGF